MSVHRFPLSDTARARLRAAKGARRYSVRPHGAPRHPAIGQGLYQIFRRQLLERFAPQLLKERPDGR
jgi:hypothetical protein